MLFLLILRTKHRLHIIDQMTDIIVAITADKGIPKAKLDQLARQTDLSLLQKNIHADYCLHISTDRLELRQRQHFKGKRPKKALSISADFAEGKAQYRRLHGGGKGQDIAKAIGLNKLKNPTVLDLTAGMGGDAFVLATLGCHVTMVERNTVIHALLKDALDRASLKNDAELQEIMARIKLIQQDSLIMLDELNETDLPDVIYIDPMFPNRTKAAQVKKEMQFFHDLVGEDIDSENLLMKSLSLAKKRIVVKRPRIAEKLTEKIEPAFTIMGKSTRYDVYLPNNH